MPAEAGSFARLGRAFPIKSSHQPANAEGHPAAFDLAAAGRSGRAASTTSSMERERPSSCA
eukprot:12902365-Alexandrium_andersonii.AAC.1